MHEENAMALQPWDLDPQELLPVGRIPDSDFINGSSGEYFGKAVRERKIVNFLVRASVSQFRRESVGVYPVDIGLAGSTEKVSVIGSNGNG